jgi:paraquat-inducible protein B
MQAQSLVTGLLYVELDFSKDASVPDYHQVTKYMKEIPTEPTQIQQLMENIAKVDFQGVTDKLNSILQKLDSSMDQMKVAEITQGLTNLLASLNRVVDSAELTNSMVSLTATADEFRMLSEKIRSKVDPITDRADETFELANAALVEFTKGVQDGRDFLSPRAPLRRDLPRAIDNLSAAALAIAELMDYLSRNPNALITGRKSSQATP